MKKAWKGWQFSDEGAVYHTDGNKAKCGWRVIVIDASKFPKDAPMIDSKWLSACDYTQTLLVKGPPIFCTASDKWLVPVENDGSKVTFLIQIADLHPIPMTATGEIIGVVTFHKEFGRKEWHMTTDATPDGTYDIIKRGDK